MSNKSPVISQRIIFPIDFPFKVLLSPPPLFTVGANIEICITLAAVPISDIVVKQFDGFIESFFMLASSGGLSGDLIPPQDSSIGEKIDVKVNQNLLIWELCSCRVDEYAVACLINLVHALHKQHTVISVEVSSTNSTTIQPLVIQESKSDFYPRMASAPFKLKVDMPISESFVLSFLLENCPTAEQIEEIENELLTWSVAPMVGAYAVPELDPEKCTMFPEYSVEIFGNEIIWGVDRFRMHPGAIDSLINCCIAISHRVLKITELEVS